MQSDVVEATFGVVADDFLGSLGRVDGTRASDGAVEIVFVIVGGDGLDFAGNDALWRSKEIEK